MSLWRLFVLSCFPQDVLGEIWDLIESVSAAFPAYFFKAISPVILEKFFKVFIIYGNDGHHDNVT